MADGGLTSRPKRVYTSLMTLRNKFLALIGSLALLVGALFAVAPANASALTSVRATGSYSILVKLDSGTNRSVTPGYTQWGVQQVFVPRGACLNINGTRACAPALSNGVWHFLAARSYVIFRY